jgi:hypothetical protein
VRTRIALLATTVAIAAVGVTAASLPVGASPESARADPGRAKTPEGVRFAAAGHRLQTSAAVRSAETKQQTETRQQAMRRIVYAWSRLLNARDNAGIARLFRLPTFFVQGTLVYRLKTAEQVALWHDALPCAGRVTSIRIAGRFATAVFLLSDRKGSRCDAPGEKAAARFEIVRGKIVSWVQVAVPGEPAASGPVA